MGQWPGWLLSLLKVALPAADHKNDLEVLAFVTTLGTPLVPRHGMCGLGSTVTYRAPFAQLYHIPAVPFSCDLDWRYLPVGTMGCKWPLIHRVGMENWHQVVALTAAPSVSSVDLLALCWP